MFSLLHLFHILFFFLQSPAYEYSVLNQETITYTVSTISYAHTSIDPVITITLDKEVSIDSGNTATLAVSFSEVDAPGNVTGEITFEQHTTNKRNFFLTVTGSNFPNPMRFNSIWKLETVTLKIQPEEGEVSSEQVQISEANTLTIVSNRKEPYINDKVTATYNATNEDAPLKISLNLGTAATVNAAEGVNLTLKDLQTGNTKLLTFSHSTFSTFVLNTLIYPYQPSPTGNDFTFRHYTPYEIESCTATHTDASTITVGVDIDKRTFLTPAASTPYVNQSLSVTYANNAAELTVAIKGSSFTRNINYTAKFSRKSKPDDEAKVGDETVTFDIEGVSGSSEVPVTGSIDSKHFAYETTHTLVSLQRKSDNLYVPILLDVQDFKVVIPPQGLKMNKINVTDYIEKPEPTEEDPDPASYAVTKALLMLNWTATNVSRPSTSVNATYLLYKPEDFFVNPDTDSDEKKDPKGEPILTRVASCNTTGLSMNITIDGSIVQYEKEYVVEIAKVVHPIPDESNFVRFTIPPRDRILKIAAKVNMRTNQEMTVTLYGKLNESRRLVESVWRLRNDSSAPTFPHKLRVGFDPVENMQKAEDTFVIYDNNSTGFSKGEEYQLVSASFTDDDTQDSRSTSNEISNVVLSPENTPQNSKRFVSPLGEIALPTLPITPLPSQQAVNSDVIDLQYLTANNTYIRVNTSDNPHIRYVECTFPDEEREKGMKKGLVHYRVVGVRLPSEGFVHIYREKDENNPTKHADAGTTNFTTTEDGTEITFTCPWIECNTTANLIYMLELYPDEESDDQLAYVYYLADGVGRGIARMLLPVLVFVLALVV